MENQAIPNEDLTVEELTDKEIKTVQKFHRQLSTHSILSIQTEDGLDEPEGPDEKAPTKISETITKEEALMMQKVLKAFGYNKQSDLLEQESEDGIDGRKVYRRLSSSESYSNTSYDYYRSSSTSRYVSPGRFYVRVSEETKAIVRDVHEKIVNKKAGYVKVETNETLGSVQWDNLHPNDIDFKMADEKINNQTPGYPSNGVGTKFGINNPEFWDSRNSLFAGSNAINGHAGYTHLSRLPPLERFKELARKALAAKHEEERRKKREFYTRLWEKRGKAGWLDLIFTIIGLGAFFADSGTDLKVASDHFTTDHPWWGTFTLILVIFPSILVNIVSYFFYKEDEEHGTVPESGWKAVKITHCCQVGLVER